MSKFRFLDLCAGIGGFHIGLAKLGGECVLACEKDKYACQTYQKWFNIDPNCDVSKLQIKDIPPYDMLVSGFPCQAFSSAGKKLGFQDKTRGTIIFDLLRIIANSKPKIVLLENVRNLLYHEGGKTIAKIREELEKLDYRVFIKELNANYWVPQDRIRIFITALRKEDFPNVEAILYGKLPSRKPILQSILQDNVSSKYTLSDRMWDYFQKRTELCKSRGYGFKHIIVKSDGRSKTITSQYYKDGKQALVSQQGKNPRRLTPREVARLMGFSDSLPIIVSDTQAYKQFGNAVVPQCVTYVAKPLVKLLESLND